MRVPRARALQGLSTQRKGLQGLLDLQQLSAHRKHLLLLLLRAARAALAPRTPVRTCDDPHGLTIHSLSNARRDMGREGGGGGGGGGGDLR